MTYSKELNNAIDNLCYILAQHYLELYAAEDNKDIIDFINGDGCYMITNSGHYELCYAYSPETVIKFFPIKEVCYALKVFKLLTPALEQELFCHMFAE